MASPTENYRETRVPGPQWIDDPVTERCLSKKERSEKEAKMVTVKVTVGKVTVTDSIGLGLGSVGLGSGVWG